jgi:hypothetical protein
VYALPIAASDQRRSFSIYAARYSAIVGQRRVGGNVADSTSALASGIAPVYASVIASASA